MLEIQQNNLGTHLTMLVIKGDLDANTAIDMDNVIQTCYEQQLYNIIINCKALAYISSAGLGVFIAYQEDFGQADRGLIFCGMNESVFSTFELLGLHHIFKIVDSEADALAKIGTK